MAPTNDFLPLCSEVQALLKKCAPLLEAALPHAAAGAPPRHKYQAEMLQAAEAALQAGRLTAQEELEVAREDMRQGQEALAAARASHDAAETLRRQALAAHEAELQASQARDEYVTLAAAEKAEADQEAEAFKERHDHQLSARAQMESALKGFGDLAEGRQGDAEGLLDHVLDLCSASDVEDTLVTAGRLALRSAPDERGEFERVIVANLGQALAEKARAVEEALAGAAREEELVQARSLGAQAMADVGTQRRQLGQARLAECSAELRKLRAAEAQAGKALAKHANSAEGYEQLVAMAEERVGTFDSALAALAQLVAGVAERATSKDEEMPAATQTETAAAAAAGDTASDAAAPVRE